MTDKEIIKAFECCYLYDVMFCDKCPNKDTCGEIDVAQYTLDLMKRQQAEIERLKSSVKEADSYISEGHFARGIAVIIRLVKEMG